MLLVIMRMLFTTPISAEEKFFVAGNTLTYATDTNEESEGITSDDVTVFSSLINSYANLRTVNLSSSGGEIQAAYEIVGPVIEQQLDTHVPDFRESACTLTILASKPHC